MKKFLVLITLCLIMASNAHADDSKSINVTIYNNDLGVVQDSRTMDLKKGLSEIKIKGVASSINPSTVKIDFKGSVLEQNYRYDLVSMSKILEKYIDKNISLINEKELIKGKLLSVGGGLVLQKADGGLTMIPDYSEYRLSVGDLPEGLITKPTLVWKIDANKSGKQDVDLSYQTSGMSWTTEYILVLSDDDKTANLSSWVNITNNSGATFKDANIKLIAGDINRVKSEQYGHVMRAGMPLDFSTSKRASFQEEAFFEYHMYTLQRQSTLKNKEQKQIALFEPKDITVKKKYLFTVSPSSSQEGNANVYVEFENTKKNTLGIPLPAGIVRLHKKNGKTNELVGEDRIKHTAKKETIELKVGDAFDVKVEPKLVDQNKINDRTNDYTSEILVKNTKEEDIEIEIKVSVYGNYEILESNYKHKKIDANTISFTIPVKADSKEKLEYEIRMGY